MIHNSTDRFREIREREFPWADGVVYLNHASIGPLPERTRRLTEQFARRRCDPTSLQDADLAAILRDARAQAARLIGAEATEIALATNTSFGIHTAALGLPIEKGETVVLPDHEFPANVFPWLRLEERGVTVERVPVTKEGWVDEERLVQRAQDPDVRVVAVSHVQFHNGYQVDLARLGEACRAGDTFLVVDSIQALGQVPFDVRRTPVDVVACGGQKWLLAPWGSGFLYVRKGLHDVLQPPFAGWMAFQGTDDFSRLTEYGTTWHADARRYEMVTLPFQDLAGFTESVGLLLELGIEDVAHHIEALKRPVFDAAARGAVALASPADHRGSGIVSVRTADGRTAYERLREAGVSCSFREGAVRLSPHCYNTVDEMERVVSILEGR